MQLLFLLIRIFCLCRFFQYVSNLTHDINYNDAPLNSLKLLQKTSSIWSSPDIRPHITCGGKKVNWKVYLWYRMVFLRNLPPEFIPVTGMVHPAYGDLDWKNRDLGNRASQPSHMNTSKILQRRDLGNRAHVKRPSVHTKENQTPVVQKVDNAIHRINHYPLDSATSFRNTYPLDG